jgi:hypothetical protein
MLVYYIGPMGFRSITYYLSNALICTVHILVTHFLYLYYTLISAYIKASICIVLLTKYNIEFQSFSLSPSLCSIWYQSYLLVAFTRKFSESLRSYRFTMIPRSLETVSLPLLSSNYSSLNLDPFKKQTSSKYRSPPNLPVAARIIRIRHYTNPHASPKDFVSPATRPRTVALPLTRLYVVFSSK